jgi:hypothetical protein
VNYPSIRIEGSILSPDLIDRLEDMPGQRPADFGLESGVKVKDDIARAWADAQDYWRIFRRKLDTLKPDSPATTETRNQWVVPLLGLLRHDLEYQKAGAELNGKIYAISHRTAGRGQTPVHIVGYRDPAGLDRKPANATLRMSAHAMVQEYLNLTEQLYGIVTNGRVIRLLRDSSRLVKQSYLEFDLDRIFTDGLFADFAVLYRLLHASRLPASTENAADSIIEKLHQDSLDSGARIREGLSRAVEEAILAFGNGFLAHPGNTRLRDRIASGDLPADRYYALLLRLVYRLLFLMVIEERGLVFPANASAKHRDLYRQCYSLQRLRALAELRYLADKRQSDLWLALLSTFRLFEADGPGAKMGLQPLAGDLFRPEAIGDLGEAQLANDALLTCLRSLGLYEHPENRQVLRVNYAALNVEEFGSVYEGLLEYEPAIDQSGTVPTFGFKAGDERAATGSHYTPDELVQPLIKHSLDYLIADRLKAPDPEEALLGLRVADIACGSGHILLAAARRIATELAIVRTDEEQPSPTAYRAALRDVIRSCIYGVDLNPLAVELCKVALWLEAHNPGQPLNFLDHHIKCGNAIVGFVSRDEVNKGVPDEAFATLPGDDKDTAAEFRKQNKAERKEKGQLRLELSKEMRDQLDAILAKWKSLSALPEKTPAEIEAKKKEFNAFTTGKNAYLLNQIAAIPIAQFYIPKTPENAAKIITDEQFRRYWSGSQTPQGQGVAAALAMAHRKRFFHWFLEFPDIVQRGGFDCILGNPPYLGGKMLSTVYGQEFCHYVCSAFAPIGMSDLVVYFLRRIYSMIVPGGFSAIITTNSIKDGSTREDGLERILSLGGSINMAVRGIKWLGTANLYVSLLALNKGPWSGLRLLDGRPAARISAFFEDDIDDQKPPASLQEMAGLGSVGVFLRGDGFMLSHEAARTMCDEDAKNCQVIREIVNAHELNSLPDHAPQRSVIDFADLGEGSASSYTLPWNYLSKTVKPIRLALDPTSKANVPHIRYWWRFAAGKGSFFARARMRPRVFAIARHTKYLSPVGAPSELAFSDALFVVGSDRWDVFAVLQSGLHESWARKYSGALKQDLRYSPSDCFDTFAFPGRLWQTANPTLAAIGEKYHEHRKGLMLSLWLGLTDIYNLFHARDLAAAKVAKVSKKSAAEAERGYQGLLELRRLHVELDQAVLHAYGWDTGGANNGTAGPINLAHDFYEVETLPENDRVRYTISPTARKEVLKRLLALNHERAKDEAAASPTKGKKKRKKGDEDDQQMRLVTNE